MNNRKTFKEENILTISSFRTVSMIPGDPQGLPDVSIISSLFKELK